MVIWSDGYFVSTVGIDEAVIKRYIEALAKKTHRGLEGRAIEGKHCGGRTYGYDVVSLGEDQGSILQINEEQVEWVRQIFEWQINERPDLRIIDDRLWKRVKNRQQAIREKSGNIREALNNGDEDRLKQIEKEIENLVNAIKMGIINPTVQSELNALEQEKAKYEKRVSVEMQEIDQIHAVMPAIKQSFID